MPESSKNDEIGRTPTWRAISQFVSNAGEAQAVVGPLIVRIHICRQTLGA
jgi:hypothetical protein